MTAAAEVPTDRPQADSHIEVTESYWERTPGRRALPLVVGVAGLAGLTALQVGVNRPRIERALRREARTALAGAGVRGVDVVIRGRDARIVGALDPADQARAHDAVRRVVGVRHVGETVRSTRAKVAGGSRLLDAKIAAGTVVLRGRVPDVATKRLLVERLSKRLGAGHVRDELVVAGGPASSADRARYERFTDVVAMLAGSGSAAVRWDGDAVRVSGAVASRLDRARIVAAAADVAGPGSVQDGLTVASPPTTVPSTIAPSSTTTAAPERLEFDRPWTDPAAGADVSPGSAEPALRLEFDGPFAQSAAESVDPPLPTSGSAPAAPPPPTEPVGAARPAGSIGS